MQINDIDGLARDCDQYSALAMELPVFLNAIDICFVHYIYIGVITFIS